MMQYVSDSGSQGICPVGWHIATNSEWQTLVDSINPPNVGRKLQAPGNPCIGTGCENLGESGFDALLGGLRYYTGIFMDIRKNGSFWTSSLKFQYPVIYRLFTRADPYIFTGGTYPSRGFSVRCLKEN
jgi:uncharacterized protein (TIGR02145 family)